ncbi:MAG: hypothetical protein Kow00120_26990 [Anaerolineae bacterium]
MTILDPPIVRAPAFGPGDWLNTEHPLTIATLRGRVTLVDFWDYSCVNCVRTLPYLTAWHERYARLGLTIVGVHAPEFPFGREARAVRAAMDEFGIRYPVLLDNDYQTWDAYANQYWPAKYLIDARGYIRYRNHGEGYYHETERAIGALLREISPDLDLPDPLPLLRPEDAPGAVCYRPTPELHAGYLRGSLGNQEGYAAGATALYTLPEAREMDHFYVEGAWRAGETYMAYVGAETGSVVVRYAAAEVNAVLSPNADAVERALHPDAVAEVEVWQDGAPLTRDSAGRDVTFTPMPIVRVTRPRMVNLVRNPGFARHELTLRVRTPGLALYAFSFSGCAAAPGATDARTYIAT